jgi:hypothetical protein
MISTKFTTTAMASSACPFASRWFFALRWLQGSLRLQQQKTCMMAAPFKIGRFNHLSHRAPDHHDEDVLPFLADNHAEEAIENALKVPSIATFVRAHEGFKRPHDDATIKTRAAPKSWLNFLDRT